MMLETHDEGDAMPVYLCSHYGAHVFVEAEDEQEARTLAARWMIEVGCFTEVDEGEILAGLRRSAPI